MKNKKAISEMVGGVLFIGISLAAIILVISLSTPKINSMQDTIAIDQAKDNLVALDRVIRDVTNEGTGSTRIIPLEIKAGNLKINKDNNTISYEIETESDIISPRTKRKIGNLYYTSNTNARAYNDSGYYYLENEHLLVNISKIGSPSNESSINPDHLIDAIHFKDDNRVITDNITIHIDDTAVTGVGYNYAEELGNDLAKARIISKFNTTTMNYTVEITLESGTDYIEIKVKDIIDK